MKTTLKILIVLLALLTIAAVGEALAQGTAFTYQGRLNDNGVPANGTYDLQFTVFDSTGGAHVVAGPVTASGVAVANGLFTVTLDFGANVFSGPPRWLQVGVRPNTGGSFVLLNPRQALTPAPYAIHAGTASDVANGAAVKSINGLKDNVTLAEGANVTLTTNGNTLTIAATGGGGGGGPWSLNGANAFYNAGNVGIGTAIPQFKLQVEGDQFLRGNAHFGEGRRQMLNLFGTGFGIGIQTATLYSRSGAGFAWHVGGTHTDTTYDSGGGTTLMTLDGTRGLDFGSRLGQHLSLWGSDGPRRFGMGIQAQTLYSRTGGNAGDGFAWHKGGAHNDNSYDPGGGKTLMTLNEENGLAISGNATQTREKGGLVKAMVYVNGDGTILRCYNGITGSSSGNCGFSSGRLLDQGSYYANFPFPINDRFYAVTVEDSCCNLPVSASFNPFGSTQIQITIRLPEDGSIFASNLTDRPFMLIVY